MMKSSLAIAATFLATIGSLTSVSAEASSEGKASTCTMTGDNSAAFSSKHQQQPAEQHDPSSSSQIVEDGKTVDNEYLNHCHIWPPTGTPPEHRDTACDRQWQNARWAVEDTDNRATPPEDLIPDTVYLNMAEEKTWVCPLDTVGDNIGGMNNNNSNNLVNVNGGGGGGGNAVLGHPTKWILHNKATSPIVLTHINALGLEVSAMDFHTFPAHSNTAVYPHGPIVLPGQMAIVDGRQGQTFIAREYKEISPMDAMTDSNGQHEHSWNSFKSVLPSTLSFLPEQTRYETNKRVWHVLGHPGRVLMKHKMGNIYIKNESGAVCPESFGGSGEEDVDDGRRGNEKDMNPDCNVMRKAFINKVGCPVDIYFAPQNKIEGYNCEQFTEHLGPLEPFLVSDIKTRDIDARKSPLKMTNTYNGHSFVARMSHDQTLVARIELESDTVRDCPEPKSTSAGAKVHVDEKLLQGSLMAINATKSDAWFAAATANASISSPILAKPHYHEKHGLLLHNRTGIISTASMPIAS